jgi:hypothetical protein
MFWGISQKEAYIRKWWPNLSPINFETRSVWDTDYNCIAFAGHDKDNRWWPTELAGYYWPNDDRSEEIEVFARAFAARFGYEKCDDGNIEPDFEKVAIYGSKDHATHMARQLKSGMWVSKLGELEDIIHLDPQDVEGPLYGNAVFFMKRLHLGA